jgi:hypothetical protein
LKEEDVGTGCGLFEIRKIGDEYESLKFLFQKIFYYMSLDIMHFLINVKIPKHVPLSYVVQIKMS